MSNFPLYDRLNNSLPKKVKDLTVKQKEEFVEKIKILEENDRDLIYALIQVYNINNEEQKDDDKNDYYEAPIELPYKGKRNKIEQGQEDLTWVFTDFPIRLRHILYNFVLMCMKKMEDEKLLTQGRN